MNATLYYGRIEMESIDHKDLLAVTIDREKKFIAIKRSAKPLAEK